MGSPVRVAAAACLVASGLVIGGAGGAFAFAAPETGDAEDSSSTGSADGAKPGTDKVGDVGQGRDGGEKADDRKLDGTPTGSGRADGNPQQKPGKEGDGRDTDQDGGEPTNTQEPEPTETPEPEPEEPPTCDEKGDDDCGPGWPWWPWGPGSATPPGDGGGVGAFELPPTGAILPPEMAVPQHVGVQPRPAGPDVSGARAPAAIGGSLAPITLPVIVAPPAALGAGGDAPSAPPPLVPSSPRPGTAEPPTGRPSTPATAGGAARVPSSYRAGYTEYLRSAQMSQVVALAAPGVAGMLLFTGVGGLVGYRQAKAGHLVRTGTAARFVN